MDRKNSTEKKACTYLHTYCHILPDGHASVPTRHRFNTAPVLPISPLPPPLVHRVAGKHQPESPGTHGMRVWFIHFVEVIHASRGPLRSGKPNQLRSLCSIRHSQQRSLHVFATWTAHPNLRSYGEVSDTPGSGPAGGAVLFLVGGPTWPGRAPLLLLRAHEEPG